MARELKRKVSQYLIVNSILYLGLDGLALLIRFVP
jgi:hypothetical protein